MLKLIGSKLFKLCILGPNSATKAQLSSKPSQPTTDQSAQARRNSASLTLTTRLRRTGARTPKSRCGASSVCRPTSRRDLPAPYTPSKPPVAATRSPILSRIARRGKTFETLELSSPSAITEVWSFVAGELSPHHLVPISSLIVIVLTSLVLAQGGGRARLLNVSTAGLLVAVHFSW